MRLFRARPVVAAEVTLVAGNRVAAHVLPGDGRSATDVPLGDRVRMVIGLVALAYQRAPDVRVMGFEECLREFAQAIVAVGDGEPGERLVHLGPLGVRDYLLLEPGDGAAGAVVAAHLLSSRGEATVPRLTASPGFAGPSLEIASLALAQSVCTDRDTGADGRLAVALGVEGVLAWYGEAHRMSQPADAVRFALVHMSDRMAQAGRTPPPGLA